jgi:membrane-associated phospholipid phosphatase
VTGAPPQRHPLLPGPARPLAVAVLVACGAVTAMLGNRYADQAEAGGLDAAVDTHVQRALGGHRTVDALVLLGDPVPVAVMAVALLAVCALTRRWRGVALVAVAVPAALAVTELVLKPLINRTLIGEFTFPSGHATGVTALAVAFAVLLVDPPRPRLPAGVRVLLALGALAAAGAVAAAIVAVQSHYATDTLGGAAVATAVVLLTALLLDGLAPRHR